MEKPILFNKEMVQAILEGRKTCTRRIIKPQPKPCNHNEYEGAEWKNDPTKWVNDGDNWYCALCGNGISFATTKSKVKGIRAPFQIGDIIYVRETWMISNPFGDFAKDNRTAEYMYKAGYAKGKRIPIVRENEKNLGVWKPSIHMPKEAARIYLKVIDVRVERLQDITEEQIKREGIKEEFPPIAHDVFQALWDSTTKEYRWVLNPWVWVIEFERIEK